MITPTRHEESVSALSAVIGVVLSMRTSQVEALRDAERPRCVTERLIKLKHSAAQVGLSKGARDIFKHGAEGPLKGVSPKSPLSQKGVTRSVQIAGGLEQHVRDLIGVGVGVGAAVLKITAASLSDIGGDAD